MSKQVWIHDCGYVVRYTPEQVVTLARIPPSPCPQCFTDGVWRGTVTATFTEDTRYTIEWDDPDDVANKGFEA